MVGQLVSSARLASDQQEGVVAAIMAREALGSTGIGRGFAIPHAKHDAVTECTGLIGQSQSGVDFAALDGEPVRLICLLISPPNRPGDHLRMLEMVSRTIRDCKFPWW
jgi:PTS system fructose-specific IIA component/PTS system nitrogen regulatory IIA component